jgi:hypothetical protein
MIQETMCSGVHARDLFCKWLKNWSFNTIDVDGLSGGLISGWSPDFQALSSSSVRNSISISLKHKKSDFVFFVVNIYGSYSDHISFWEELSNAGTFFIPNLVIGGDLNFTLSLREVWGSNPREDRKKSFFLSFMEENKLVDLELTKLSPTWRNFRTGNEEVAKRLDHFLVSELMLSMGSSFRSVVESGDIFDHQPISLQWISGMDSPPSPMKISQVWLEEDNFRKMVSSTWKKLSSRDLVPCMVQFANNLKNLKVAIKKWLPIWKSQRLRNLKETEQKLYDLYKNIDEGPLTEAQLEELKNLENLHSNWLKNEETQWRLKSRALWL